ncbi:MAG: hypothetical protein N2C12_05885, partial [Planctomycetales bacterium]
QDLQRNELPKLFSPRSLGKISHQLFVQNPPFPIGEHVPGYPNSLRDDETSGTKLATSHNLHG